MNSDPRRQPTTDMSLRRANLLASLDLERAAETSRRRENPNEDLARRLERVEAAIYQLARQLNDVEGVAHLAAEQAESVSGAW